MKYSLLRITAIILEMFNINLDCFFDYYKERSVKLSIHIYCRRNKYTNRKYFRTMRPICNGWNSNEWIEYGNKVDDLIIYKK